MLNAKKNTNWLTHFLFAHTPRQTFPDGRPLYAYKMNDATYASLRNLCDWIQERLFSDQKLPGNSELNIARRCPSFLEQQIESREQELQGRHDAEEKWPESAGIIGFLPGIDVKRRYLPLNPVFRSVRCAPFVAAHLSLQGIVPTESLIHELQLLRVFDRDWFDNVYAIALTLGLAHRPLES
ncbi:MAG: hypothetical protein QG599_426 [Pseudomonadota bacterium]|nr:hypothetical protein [Pseudomonadota bacterium]